MKVEQLLKNKYVLYAVFFLAITNVLGYLTIRDFRSITLFIAIALLTSHFTKNMIVMLGAAMVFTNLFTTGRLLEGLKNKSKDDETKDEESDASEEPSKEEKKPSSGEVSKDKCPDGKCDADKPKKESFSQQNVPSSTPAPATESEEDDQVGKRIDYAATLEQAYDNLQGILGAKGMDGLTKETQKLISQQSSLMKTLNSMTPVLNTAKSTLDKFDIGSLTSSLGSLQSMIGKQK